jgi:hypothetical protein
LVLESCLHLAKAGFEILELGSLRADRLLPRWDRRNISKIQMPLSGVCAVRIKVGNGEKQQGSERERGRGKLSPLGDGLGQVVQLGFQ